MITAVGALAIGLAVLLVGCTATDPLLSENTWQPTGVNDANIAAQVANPIDLLHGREPAGDADGELAAAAVLRLRSGHVKPLPDSALTDLHIQVAPSSGTGP